MANAAADGATSATGTDVELNYNGAEPPLLANYTPDQGGLEKSFALGKRVAESLIQKA